MCSIKLREYDEDNYYLLFALHNTLEHVYYLADLLNISEPIVPPSTQRDQPKPRVSPAFRLSSLVYMTALTFLVLVRFSLFWAFPLSHPHNFGCLLTVSLFALLF
jgi:hypothetical protein